MLENPRLPRRQAQELTNMLSQKRSTSQAPRPSTLLVSSLNSATKTAPKERRYMTPDSHASA